MRNPQGLGAPVEERALYRAVLDAPHDDAARLVYADWLDEHAGDFPPLQAASERGRAELIRLQCSAARLAPEGWRAGLRARDPALKNRERRLLFQHGRKWRRALSHQLSSAPFDRGFLRPFRALRPQELLNHPLPFTPHYRPLPPLPDDSPSRRFAPTNDPLAACPLWDVHLFASDWYTDPLADRAQFGPLLGEVALSPALSRIGWLKLSFFRTPVLELLAVGNFANVETLVLNCWPSAEVLDAVAGNDSFRSLRYVRFGSDVWQWAQGDRDRKRLSGLEALLQEANDRHVPFGEMRAVLGSLLRNGTVSFPPAASRPLPVPELPDPFDLAITAPTHNTAANINAAPYGCASAFAQLVASLSMIAGLLVVESLTPTSPYPLPPDPPVPIRSGTPGRTRAAPPAPPLPIGSPAPTRPEPPPVAPPPREVHRTEAPDKM
jgi:uncharacterized protein (TIGR02996 family)